MAPSDSSRTDQIEAAEQHRQLGAIELNAVGARGNGGHSKAALREALVAADEAAAAQKRIFTRSTRRPTKSRR